MKGPLRWVTSAAFLIAAGATRVDGQEATYLELQRFSGVMNHVRLNYVDEVDYAELVRGAIRGALETLDPHSSFLARADWQRLDALDRGELATVGLHLEHVDGSIVVRSVDAGSPAARAGLVPGDRVIEVDAVTVEGLQPREVELALAGEEGVPVVVGLERGPTLDPASFEVRLEREMPDERSVTHTVMLDDTTGYIALSGFGEEAARELERALRDLRGDGAERMLIDLRGNPGGLVTQAADAAALFLPDERLLFSTRGRKSEANEDYFTESNGRFRDLPLILLVDEGSASAAEALAATLQDHDRALIIGRTTFGKALVQAPFFLQGGDVAWLTIAHLVSPSGRVIQRPYRGRRVEEYRATAGSASDTAAAFRTTAGREVSGGGGVTPDVHLPAPAQLAAWWSEALQRGIASAVANSVGHGRPGASIHDAAWRDAHLVAPLLDRVRDEFGVEPELDADERTRVGVLLAERAVAAAAGQEAAADFRLRHDPDVGAARGLFGELPARLSRLP